MNTIIKKRITPCNHSTRFRLYFTKGRGIDYDFGTNGNNPTNQDCLVYAVSNTEYQYFPCVKHGGIIVIDVISKDLLNVQAQIGEKLFCRAFKIEKLGNVIF